MAQEKAIIKFAFCFTASKLNTWIDAFELLKISKTKTRTEYAPQPLEMDFVERIARSLSVNVRRSLENFTSDNFYFQQSEHKKYVKRQKMGTSVDVFLSKALLKDLHVYFKELTKVQHEISIYHKIKNPKTGNLLTAPCSFSESIPKLSFEVIKQPTNNLSLKCYVTIDEEIHELSQYNRNGFLLEQNNKYYILSIIDTYTLDGLDKSDISKYGKEDAAFIQKVVHPLEQRYNVKKDKVINRKEIKAKPENCIYLSEINSGSFLMLTPQWKYEEVLVEGEYKEEHETTIDGEIYCIYRDREAETAFLNCIKGLHTNFSKQFNGYFFLSFEEAKKKNWFLKCYHQLLAQNVELIGMDLLGHFRYSPYQIQTEFINIKTTDYLIEATLKIYFGPEEVNLVELQKVLQNHQKNILLNDNSIGMLDDEWLQNYSTLLTHSKIEKDKILFPKWLLISAKEIAALESLKFIINEGWWQKWTTWQDINSTLYEVPKTVNATLRPYQQKGYEWMRLLSEINAGICLADDMGLGKTLQTICFLAAQLEQKPKERFIIVCPGSLIYNWQLELQKFCPEFKSFIYYANNRKLEDFLENDYNILITPYSTLRADIDRLKNIFWNTIVLDESHNIKTLYAQTTKAVYQIIAKNRIALSGTPVINNTFDLYAQLNYLLPGFLGTQDFFKKEYVLPIDRDRNKDKVAELNKLTQPFILRRTKAQVATDLPAKTELVLWCEMEETQREIYDTIKNKIRRSVFLNIKNDGLNKSKLSVLQGIIKLRQACCSPILLKDETLPISTSIKIEVLLDEIQNNLSGNKVLVFSQFKEMLHLIAKELMEKQISYFHFDGDTKVEDRMDLVSEFQKENNTTNVFLMSLKTGNAGITLTAADYVFLVDPWWNTAIEQQAIDRTHRIGQTKNVFAYKMICRNSIEEKIIEIQQRKKITSDGLINEEENFVKNLTQEDISYLFE